MNVFADHKPAAFSTLSWLLACLLVLSIMLGGSTRAGYLSDAVLQLASLPLFLLALARSFGPEATGGARIATALCLMAIAVPALQLVPLPAGLSIFAGHKPYLAAAGVIGAPNPSWLPTTTDVRATAITALSLLPPAAIFLAALHVSRNDRRTLTLLLIAAGVASMVLGIVQVAQGPASSLRFYTYTNLQESVGFFANRNHLAALGYVLLLFAAGWTVHATELGTDETIISPRFIASTLIWFTILVLLLAGETLTRSRAGLGLTMVALFGAFLIAVAERKRTASSGGASTWLLTAAILGTVMLGGQFVLFRLLERFTGDPLADSRIAFARNTIASARDYMPFGSGFGTFVPVYGDAERTGDVIANIYANHAHNDVLELWLEAGIPGLLVMAVFGFWLFTRTVAVWRKPKPDLTPIDATLMRAALIALLLLSLHSLADYPLRTNAMMGAAAFCCAMLIPPSVAEPEAAPAQTKRRKGKKAAASEAAQRATEEARKPKSGDTAGPTPAGQPTPETGPLASSPKPRVLWTGAAEWPEEWKTGAGRDQSRRAGTPSRPETAADRWSRLEGEAGRKKPKPDEPEPGA